MALARTYSRCGCQANKEAMPKPETARLYAYVSCYEVNHLVDRSVSEPDHGHLLTAWLISTHPALEMRGIVWPGRQRCVHKGSTT